MKTVAVQIGNSDDKLSQKRWSEFITSTSKIATRCREIHFAGSSAPTALWQNYCFIANIHEDEIGYLKEDIIELRKEFGQDSIALTIGETEFV